MAQATILSTAKLDQGYVLTPERYDPRRKARLREGIALRDITNVRNESLTPSEIKKQNNVIVLDTNYAKEGFITISKAMSNGGNVKSNKKRIQKGDVIISRLRPYLRQVGAVWGAQEFDDDQLYVCVSTEFYILKPSNEEILWLAPFLLSNQAQQILCAAQEGGHHPRFNIDTLMNIQVPKAIWENRKQSNHAVKNICEQFHIAKQSMSNLIIQVNDVCESIK